MIRSRIGRRSLRGGVRKRRLIHTYDDIISAENLLEAWKEFKNGKGKKQDVQEFQADLMANIVALHRDLKEKTYTHGGYHHFKISDPKPRDIHKASVRDRLLHHAIYRKFYPYFDTKFIYDSYSCRLRKGTHRAMDRFRAFAYQVSKNHTRTCWVLKCDIRKFFASINRKVLLDILRKYISDLDILWLLTQVTESFDACRPIHQHVPIGSEWCMSRKGLPLGNLTSQLLVNIYMNEFDQWVKHTLKVKYYLRYADDFVILSHDRKELEALVPYMELFLWKHLRLRLHPNKVFIKTFTSGVDFLGWVHFPDHRVLRTATKKRMFRRLRDRKGTEGEETTKESYLGMLRHGNTKKLQNKISVIG